MLLLTKKIKNMKVTINERQLLKYIKWFFWIYWIPIVGNWWLKLYLERLNYTFEDDHFLQERGVFFYSKKRVPYSGIREASIYRGPLCQLLGFSIVIAHTAAQNVGIPEIYILCPDDPEQIIKEFTRRKNLTTTQK